MSSCSQVTICRSDVLRPDQALTLAPFSKENYKKFALQPFMEGLSALHSVFEMTKVKGWTRSQAIQTNPELYLLPEVAHFFPSTIGALFFIFFVFWPTLFFSYFGSLFSYMWATFSFCGPLPFLCVGYFFSGARFSFWSQSDAVKDGADLKEEGEDAIHRYIDLAFQKMSTAEEVSLAQVDALGSNAEELRNQQKSLNDNKKSLEEQLNNLNFQLPTLHKELENNTSKLELAQKGLKSTNSILTRAQSDQHHYGVVRKVGIGMFFIPVIGLIIGSIMVGVGAKSANYLRKKVDKTAQIIHAQKAAVVRSEQECKKSKESIADTEKSIAASTRKIQDLQREIEQNVAFQQKLQDFLIPLKRCTTFLSFMAGKTRVANILAELKVTINTLLPVLEDIEKTICPVIRENENLQQLNTLNMQASAEKLDMAY